MQTQAREAEEYQQILARPRELAARFGGEVQEFDGPLESGAAGQPRRLVGVEYSTHTTRDRAAQIAAAAVGVGADLWCNKVDQQDGYLLVVVHAMGVEG